MKHVACAVMALIVLFAFGPSLGARQVYQKKPYTEWTPKEAKQVLNDSPWGYRYTITNAAEMFWDPARGASYNQEAHAHFFIRWLSAKPVRQALTRVVDWSKVPDDQQAAMKAGMEEFVNRSFPDQIIIGVDFDSNQPDIKNQIWSTLKSVIASEIKNKTYLIAKGDRRVWLQDYQPPGNDGVGAKFIFPRMVEGAPFLTATDKDVRFVTEVPRCCDLNIRFNVSKMMYEDRLEY